MIAETLRSTWNVFFKKANDYGTLDDPQVHNDDYHSGTDNHGGTKYHYHGTNHDNRGAHDYHDRGGYHWGQGSRVERMRMNVESEWVSPGSLGCIELVEANLTIVHEK